MKKIINDPKNFVSETISGIIAAHGDKLKLLNDDYHVVLSNYPVKPGKVGIVTGGGSGHLPVFLGYVGDGMLDACVVGNVFASPSAGKMEAAIRACDFGSGVLCLFGNYSGDGLNFDMACEAVNFDDIETREVRVTDDVASSPKTSRENRRGVAGLVFAYKIAGAAAASMLSLDDVARIAQKAVDNTRSMGVALSACTIPEVGVPAFVIGENEMEVGMGIHGEPGIERTQLKTADEIADIIMDAILADIDINSNDKVSVLVNGLGATPLEELYIVYRHVHQRLSSIGVDIVMPHIGNFAASMEMAGMSVSVIKLDSELETLLRAPASTPFYTNSNK